MMANGLIDTRNARVSPLLLLPAELRNQIYNYVLASDSIKIVTPRATKRSGYSIVEKATNVIIGISRVCQQITAETISMPCATDTVHFASVNNFEQNAATLSASQRAAVTKLSVNIEMIFVDQILDRELRITDWFSNVKAVDLCRTSRADPIYHRLRNDVEASLVLICSYDPDDRAVELCVEGKRGNVSSIDLGLLIGECEEMSREGKRTS
ncbi:hypothetical protein HBI82_054710 [Parastagonospora nodorum]|nr:hypothetical protein HBH43_116970 [Parastagonospora nodorum]KAH5273074.1 hypothetical protein HBI72_055710 [Parastagonospora nodorum]KAH5390232.1 hypothetical protein HBI33_028430 [Parastagonospora nodorum]KAH5497803.1 hypothetical protein HBI31_092170 [Parastagonospora nodorum]KAH5608547.1 hypothetical protein HBI45_076890 [Parastagonospora nodorum]